MSMDVLMSSVANDRPNEEITEFLKPLRPISRPVMKDKDKRDNRRLIFDKIRDLCRTPTQFLKPIDNQSFLCHIFSDIRQLCERPQLITPIEDQLVVQQINDEEVVDEVKVFKKRIKKYYCDTNSDTNLLSFDIINKSKVFCTLIKPKSIKIVNNTNDVVTESLSDKRKATIKRKTSNDRTTCNKRVARKPLKPILSIDCDITSKINEYSKLYSKPNPKKTSCDKTKTKSVVTNNESIIIVDTTYESVSSPSVSYQSSLPYSMPATPVSTTESSVSSQSSLHSDISSTSSLLSQIRKQLNPRFESYRQYADKCNQKKTTTKKCYNKKVTKREIDFNKKVLEWKANRLGSGNTTPLHNIEFLETPPGSPLKKQSTIEDKDTNVDELNQFIDNLENEDFMQLDDNLKNEFNSLLSDLYSDIVPEDSSLVT